MAFKRIAIDTSKHAFTPHAVDEQERPVLRRNCGVARSRNLPSWRRARWCWRRAADRTVGAGGCRRWAAGSS